MRRDHSIEPFALHVACLMPIPNLLASYTLSHTSGIAPGMTVQFAEGRWPGEIGTGVSMSDAAFDCIEPHVKTACSGWTSDHRFGVYELPLAERKALARALRDAEGTSPERELCAALSDWLDG